MEYKYGRHRFFEMIPGFLVWGTLATAVVLAFVAPVWAIRFIIVFDLYWMYRVFYFIIYVVHAWREHRKAEKQDWMQQLKKEFSDWDQYWHLVFLPTYKEPIDIIDATLANIRDSSYPNEKFLIVLAGEERDEEQFRRNAERLKKTYGDVFHRFFVTVHPADLPGEVPGKGANLHYAGGEVKKEIDALEIPYEDIIVSSFDVDTIAHPQYFAHLTHVYASQPDPTRASYQPVVLFNNNMWESPAPVRVMAFGTTFWLFGELARPERLWTFSSHSMPFKMLVDVGFWQKDIVSEDSRIFLQAAIRYKGDYRVEPLYLPVSMDAVTGESYWKSLVALYKQQRRWAWGVEHFPFMMVHVLQNARLPKWLKVKLLWNHVEGMFTWATAPILIFILGWLPLQVAEHRPEAIVQNAPFTLERIMILATFGVFFSGAMSFFLLPRRPEKVGPWNWLVMIVQWGLLPLTFITLGALPSIDAQTRLMLGKYLGFNVTAKARK